MYNHSDRCHTYVHDVTPPRTELFGQPNLIFLNKYMVLYNNIKKLKIPTERKKIPEKMKNSKNSKNYLKSYIGKIYCFIYWSL